MWILNRAPSVCFIAAGMNKMEVKNQQIQTEIVKTVEQHVQAGSTAKQQGVCCENKSMYEEEETTDIATLLSFYSDLFILCNNSDTCTVVLVSVFLHYTFLSIQATFVVLKSLTTSPSHTLARLRALSG